MIARLTGVFARRAGPAKGLAGAKRDCTVAFATLAEREAIIFVVLPLV